MDSLEDQNATLEDDLRLQRIAISSTMPHLTARERFVVLCRLRNESQPEIAEKLGVSPSRVSQIQSVATSRMARILVGGTERKRNVKVSNQISPSSITERQIEVLLSFAEGNSARETAKELFVTVETIKSHRRHIITALQARNMAHAIAIAFRSGMIR